MGMMAEERNVSFHPIIFPPLADYTLGGGRRDESTEVSSQNSHTVTNSDMITCMKKWWAQCGDIYSLCIGNRLLVIVNGYDLIKETFAKSGDDFSDRPSIYFDEMMNYHNKGILTSSGPVWKEHRRLALNILRKFGLGKDILAKRVLTEVSHYLDLLGSCVGRPVNIRSMTAKSTANIIRSVVVGRRFDYEDPIFKKLVAEIDKMSASNQPIALLNFLSFLKYLPGDILKIKSTHQNFQEMYSLCQHFIEISKDKGPEDNFIASYMAEKETIVQNGGQTSMDDVNLLKCVFDLLIAGTETTSTTVCWFVLYMLHYQDVQRKIFDEICQNVGMDRTPTVQDRPSLVYLNATIMEVQRITSIVPSSVPRTCSKTVIIRNYTLPEGTIIAPNLDSVLFDEKIWGPDASSFRPERFIDKGGQLKNSEEFVPFGVGRRVCLGESMAKTELFLCLGSMIQRFQLLPEDPSRLPPMKYISGLTLIPEAYQVKIIERRSQVLKS